MLVLPVLLQLVAIDGEYYDPTASSPLHTIKTLLQSDNVSGALAFRMLGTTAPLQSYLMF